MSDTYVEIQQVIEKNLPTQVGNTLKKVLDDYEKLKVAYNHLESKIDDKANIIKRLEKENEDLRMLKINKEVLDDREKTILEREKKLELELKQKDVECANSKVALMQENFNTVFRNVDIIRDKLGNVMTKNRDTNGNEWYSTEPIQPGTGQETERKI